MKKKNIIKYFLIVFVAALALRERGAIDFHFSKNWAVTSSQTSVETINYTKTSPTSVSQIAKVGDLYEVEYSSGQCANVKIESIEFHGFTYVPIFKTFTCRAKLSLSDSAGTFSGMSDVSTNMKVFGSISVRRAKEQARVACVNQFLSDTLKSL